jgi:hypothetical protein
MIEQFNMEITPPRISSSMLAPYWEATTLFRQLKLVEDEPSMQDDFGEK